MCQNCQKMCKAQKVQKSPKTALSGLANKVPERSVLWVPECQSRPRSLVQPSPAFSSWFQPGQGPGALPSCPEVQGECLAFRELPREVTRPRSPSLLSHVLTFNLNFNMSLPSMNVMWVWILFNLEYAWLNFSFPHLNLFYFIWIDPHSNLI